MGAHEPGAVIADDGEYFIELGAREGGVSAPSFLPRRCHTGITSPDGFESVGGFARNPAGRREALIDARNDGSGAGVSRSIGHFADRMNAIVAMRRTAATRIDVDAEPLLRQNPLLNHATEPYVSRTNAKRYSVLNSLLRFTTATCADRSSHCNASRGE